MLMDTPCDIDTLCDMCDTLCDMRYVDVRCRVGQVYKAKLGLQTVAVKEINCSGHKEFAAFQR
jgi:hypothetical protein